MLEILQHTPVWVYIVFVVLLYLSIRACFSHEVNTRQAIIFPLVFILLLYFFLRYYLGYQEAVRGGVLQLTTTQLILFFCSSGFTTGFFIARAWLLRKYYVSLNHAST